MRLTRPLIIGISLWLFCLQGCAHKCKDFQTDVEEFWNEESRTEVDAAIVQLDVEKGRTTSHAVITKMDDITRDWVMLSEKLCKDCYVREIIPKADYQARSVCFDEFLISQRQNVNLMKNMDKMSLSKAMELMERTTESLRLCQRAAIAKMYSKEELEQAEAGVVFSVGEHPKQYIQEADTMIIMAKFKQAKLAAETALEYSRKGSNSRLEAESLTVLAEAQMHLAEYKDARVHFKEAESIGQKEQIPVIRSRALAGLGYLLLREYQYAEAQADFERAKHLLVDTIGKDNREYVRILIGMGRVHGGLAEYDKAFALFDEAAALANQLSLSLEEGEALYTAGYFLLDMSEYQQAISKGKQAMEIIHQAFGETHPAISESGHLIARGWVELGHPKTGLKMLEQFLQVELDVYGDGHPYVAVSYDVIGSVYATLEDYEQAMDYYTRSLTIRKKAFGSDSIQIANCYTNIGRTLSALSHYEKARYYYDKAYAMVKNYFGVDHVNTAFKISDFGDLELALGNYDDAGRHYNKTLTILKQTYGENSMNVAMTYRRLGWLSSNTGRYDEALAWYEKANRIMAPFNQQLAIAWLQLDIGQALYMKDENERALQLYKKAIVVFEDTFGTEHPNVAWALTLIGRILQEAGNIDQAVAAYEEAYRINIQFYGEMHRTVAISLNDMARALFEAGKYGESKVLFLKSLEIDEKILPEGNQELEATRTMIERCDEELNAQGTSHHLGI
ncbi:MAG: tetratricopeptide repeat protein [Deltaproteobacteria bacterium]|nr:tetratricopeptide repeat protein [Deltaproteobacteria bacterium]MBN2671387.1 tetratricopeptide repeat protein [Deltaproteobacteria bacterium]